MTEVDLVLRLFLQVLVILTSCKVIGWVGRRFLGQTQVVMEMLVGVLLGPSLFGLLAPKAQAWLFPSSMEYVANGVIHPMRHPSMFLLYAIAQIGLVLYMFLVGLEFNADLVKTKAKGAISISLAGIIAPFALGAILAAFTYQGWGLFTSKVDMGASALYFGAALCITAFPMLARIIYESGIANTSMGTLALGAGAAGDVFAWSLLAVVLAFAKQSWTYAAFAIGGGLFFGFVVLRFGRVVFAPMAKQVETEGFMSQGTFVTTLLCLFAGAWVTDAIGIFAVFGAFLIGAAMPRGKFAEQLQGKLESVSVGLFLPFFFVYSGLNTHLNSIDSPKVWLIAILVIIAAVGGKGVACALAARRTGEGWQESWAIGVLMNSRGLMELIILNIGLQEGIVTQRMFSIMVLMAIATTLMASPIFRWIYNRHLQGMSQPGPVYASALE